MPSGPALPDFVRPSALIGAQSVRGSRCIGNAVYDIGAVVAEQHRAYFDGSFSSVNVYDRVKLRAGNRIRGPAIIIQMDATTVIHPNHTGEVDEYLSILIRPDKAS